MTDKKWEVIAQFQASQMDDIEVRDVCEKHGGQFVGGGIMLATATRDVQYEFERQIDAQNAAAELMSFGIDSVIRSPDGDSVSVKGLH